MAFRSSVRQVTENNIIWYVKKAMHKIYKKVGINRLSQFIKRLFGCAISFFRYLLHFTSESDKRILAVWDFSTVPYSIGDLIILHERMQILRLTHKVDKVDICFICDPQKPVRKAGEQGVTPDNFHYHFPPLVSTVYANPHVGSFFIFDSRDQFDKFIVDNRDKYFMWPEIAEYSNKYRSYRNNFNFIRSFYQKNNFIPPMEFRASTVEWAYTFYKENVLPNYPIVVQLRNNSQEDPKRNAALDSWLEFFKSCVSKFNIKFILIGAGKEVDERFRDLPNVLVAKDYNTSVEKDLILAYSSLSYLGSTSGPACAVYFCKTPYILFNYRGANDGTPRGDNFNFATDLQKLIWVSETPEILMKEFSKLFYRIDKLKWKENMIKFMSSRDKETFQSRLLWSE